LDYLIIPKGFSLTNSYFFMELTLFINMGFWD
jgi:hypothetical protein